MASKKSTSHFYIIRHLNDQSKMKTVFFVLWGDPKFYQTLIFLAQNLSKKGFNIFILSKNTKKAKKIIKNVNFGKNSKLIVCPNFISGYSNQVDYFFFIFFVLINYFIKKPGKIIFFNKKALFTSVLLNIFKLKKTKFIYHNFDFELIGDVNKLKEKLLIRFEFFCSKKCEYLIFPSQNRSKLFKLKSKNKSSKIYSFMNCFPLKNEIKISNKLKKILSKNNLEKKKIICYLGSIGPDHYLVEIVRSFKYLNDDIILIIGGISINNYTLILKNIISKNKLDHKVYIFENITNEFWFDILNNSMLGLCFYKPSVLSHKYMAGTSQKFNNYLLFKKPMLVNENKDFNNFKKKFDIFNMVNPQNPKNISNEIKNLIYKSSRYKNIKKNMKRSFEKELNFETQFANSYDKIL